MPVDAPEAEKVRTLVLDVVARISSKIREDENASVYTCVDISGFDAFLRQQRERAESISTYADFEAFVALGTRSYRADMSEACERLQGVLTGDLSGFAAAAADRFDTIPRLAHRTDEGSAYGWLWRAHAENSSSALKSWLDVPSKLDAVLNRLNRYVFAIQSPRSSDGLSFLVWVGEPMPAPRQVASASSAPDGLTRHSETAWDEAYPERGLICSVLFISNRFEHCLFNTATAISRRFEIEPARRKVSDIFLGRVRPIPDSVDFLFDEDWHGYVAGDPEALPTMRCSKAFRDHRKSKK